MGVDIYEVITQNNLTCSEHTAWITWYDGVSESRFENMSVGIMLGMMIYTIIYGLQKIVYGKFIEPLYKKDRRISYREHFKRLDVQTNTIASLYLISNTIFVSGHLAHQACLIPYLAWYKPDLFIYL